MNLTIVDQRNQHQGIHQSVLVIGYHDGWSFCVGDVFDAVNALDAMEPSYCGTDQLHRQVISQVSALDGRFVEGLLFC